MSFNGVILDLISAVTIDLLRVSLVLVKQVILQRMKLFEKAHEKPEFISYYLLSNPLDSTQFC